MPQFLSPNISGVPLRTQVAVKESPLAGVGEAISGLAAQMEKSEMRAGESQMMADFSAFQDESIKRYAELSQERQQNPDNFTNDFLKERDEAFQQYMERSNNKFFKEAMQGRYQQYRGSLLQKAITYEGKQKSNLQKANIMAASNNIAGLVYNDPSYLPQALQELEGNYAAARANAIIPDAETRKVQDRENIVYSAFAGMVGTKNFSEAEALLNSGALGNVSDKAQKLLRAGKANARREQEKAIRQQEAEFSKYQDELVESLEAKAFQGELTQEELDLQYDDGAGYLEGSDYRRISKALAKEQEEEIKRIEGMQRVSDAIHSEYGGVLDPLSKADQEAASDYLEQVLATTVPDKMASSVIKYSDKFGFIPKRIEDNLRLSIAQGTVDQKTLAAKTITGLFNVDPQAASTIDNKTLAMSQKIKQNLDMGHTPQAAVELAEKMTFQEDSPGFKERKQAMLDLTKEDKFTPSSGGYLFGFFGGGKMPQEMTGEIKAQAQRLYLYEGMEPKKALEQAERMVGSTWRKTPLAHTGEYMKFAPELYAPKGASPTWVQDQIYEELQGNVEKDNIRLIVDPSTMSKEVKSYFVMEYDKEMGVSLPVLGANNERMRYTPDYGLSKEYKEAMQKRKEKREKTVKSAYAERATAIDKAKSLESRKQNRRVRFNAN